MGDFTAFSGCAGESGCFGASAIAPAVAFLLFLFATIFLTDFLLAVGLANKSIFVADGFTDELANVYLSADLPCAKQALANAVSTDPGERRCVRRRRARSLRVAPTIRLHLELFSKPAACGPAQNSTPQSAIEGAAIGQRGHKYQRVSDKFNARKQGRPDGLDFVLQLWRGCSNRSRLVGGVQHTRHLLLGLRALTRLGFKFSPKHIQLVGQTVLARAESLNRGDKPAMELILMPLRGGERLREKGYSKIFGIGGSGANARFKLGSENPSKPVLDVRDVRTLELDEPVPGQALNTIAKIAAHSRDEDPFLTNDRGRALRVKNRTFDNKIRIGPVYGRPSATNTRSWIPTFAREKGFSRRFDPLARLDGVRKPSPDCSLSSIGEKNDSAVRLTDQLSVIEDCDDHEVLFNRSF
jgi:hypothetical protein